MRAHKSDVIHPPSLHAHVLAFLCLDGGVRQRCARACCSSELQKKASHDGTKQAKKKTLYLCMSIFYHARIFDSIMRPHMTSQNSVVSLQKSNYPYLDNPTITALYKGKMHTH